MTTAATYKTIAGDVLDEIVWRHYGTQSAALLRSVLDANPKATAYDDALPAGLTITLPAAALATDSSKRISLWD